MYKIFEQIINERNLRIVDVAKGAGVSYSVITDWKAGRSTPKTDNMRKIANFLNVSVESLTGGTPTKSPPKYEITPFEYQLILAYRTAGPLQEAVDKLLNLEEIKKGAVFTA